MRHIHFSYCLALGALCVLILGTPTRTLAASGPSKVFIPLATNGSSGNVGVSNGLSEEEQQVVELTNAQRTAAGCKPLNVSFKLMTAARNHTQDMANTNTMSHTGSDGSSFVDRYERVGYQWQQAAENIAAGYPSPADVVNGWMNSAGHRKNILDCSMTEIGVGYAYSQDGRSAYWTQDFATPR